MIFNLGIILYKGMISNLGVILCKGNVTCGIEKEKQLSANLISIC